MIDNKPNFKLFTLLFLFFVGSNFSLHAQPDPDNYCTFTQGYYGNPNGIQFGETTIQIITNALSDNTGQNDPIILGLAGRSLTLNKSAAECIIEWLPGGGPSKKLPAGDLNIDSNCDSGSLPIRKGRIKNNLLSQTIALALNMRYDDRLANLSLENACIEPSNSIYNLVGEEATIGDLFEYANQALGGDVTKNLGTITAAIGAINDHFTECQSACGEVDDNPPPPPPPLLLLRVSELEDVIVFPNPAKDFISINLKNQIGKACSIQIYDQLGKLQYEANFEKLTTETISVNLPNFAIGIYALNIKTNSQQVSRKFLVTK